METLDVARYKLTERRIAHLTLAIGVTAAAGGVYFSSLRMGAGILAGSVLAWISFHWLETALDGLMRASTAKADSAQARLPVGSIFKIMARYALIAGAVCVIFFVFQVPVLGMLIGLCALGAATIVATLYELWHSAS
jgi:hypothetical protein